MVGVGIRFDLGRYHATPWGANVNDATVEWPPSPWRLIRALYATARTHTGLAPHQPAIDRALGALARGGPPSFRLPATLAAHSRHYMPRTSYSFVDSGKTTKVLDGFLAIDPAATVEVWWDVALDGEEHTALDAVVRALPYLGRSEAVCSAALLDEAQQEEPNAVPLVATDADDDVEIVDLLCLDADQPLDAVSVSVTDLRRRRRRLPPGARRIPYAVRLPEPTVSKRVASGVDGRPQLAVFRLGGSDRPGITEAVMVGQALRKALQSRYGQANDRAASVTFSGRAGERPRGDQHQHAHYLAIPERHSPRIGQLVVWAPEGFGPRELGALDGVTYLKLPGNPNQTPCVLTAVGDRSALGALSVLGTSRRWRSVTPFGLVRHPKRRSGRVVDSPEDQVRAELRHRGRFPEPEDVQFKKDSWHRFRSSKVGATRLQRASLYGLELRFATEVDGPIAIGALCHYGLGLMEPVDD